MLAPSFGCKGMVTAMVHAGLAARCWSRACFLPARVESQQLQ